MGQVNRRLRTRGEKKRLGKNIALSRLYSSLRVKLKQDTLYKTKPDQENTLMIQECLEEKCKVSRVRMGVSTRAVPEVMSPILLC